MVSALVSEIGRKRSITDGKNGRDGGKNRHRGNGSSIGEYRRARESSRRNIAENARPDANDQRGKISGARGGCRVARKIANRADLAGNHFIFRATMTHRWQTREPYPMIDGVRRKTRRRCVCRASISNFLFRDWRPGLKTGRSLHAT